MLETMRSALVRLLALSVAACATPPPPAAPAPVTEIVPAADAPVIAPALLDSPTEATQPDGPEAWLQRWGSNVCDSFDYHPNGGLQSSWCHRPAALTFAALAETARVPVFASGPHATELDLSSTREFGHYNPAFVDYLIDHGVHPRGSVVQRATQSSYDQHLKPLAAIFWKTRAKLQADPKCFAREKSAYAAAIKGGVAGYYERWFYFMNPAYCSTPRRSSDWLMRHGSDGGVDGNVTKTVVGFWLRRSMDGTFESFGTGLEKLFAAYDPEAMSH